MKGHLIAFILFSLAVIGGACSVAVQAQQAKAEVIDCKNAITDYEIEICFGGE